MEIIVLGKKVETKEICDIVDIEAGKKMFLNTQAGFILKLIDKPDMLFYDNIPYSSSPSEIADIKSRWQKLKNIVYEKWQKDISQLEIFDFKKIENL